MSLDPIYLKPLGHIKWVLNAIKNENLTIISN